MKKVKITNDVFIPFEAMHKSYGRAEFVICPVLKRGKIVQVSIFPRQQERKDYFVWEGKVEGLGFSGYEGLDAPKIWRTFYCKEHNCNSIELYVPNDAKYLWITVSLGSLCINFTKTKWR